MSLETQFNSMKTHVLIKNMHISCFCSMFIIFSIHSSASLQICFLNKSETENVDVFSVYSLLCLLCLYKQPVDESYCCPRVVKFNAAKTSPLPLSVMSSDALPLYLVFCGTSGFIVNKHFLPLSALYTRYFCCLFGPFLIQTMNLSGPVDRMGTRDLSEWHFIEP